jgi:hypothetical protein
MVSKPFMERRSVATARRQTRWPEIAATSAPEGFDAFCQRQGDAPMVISDMVGDLQRLREYPGLGYCEAHDIPQAVWAAFELLVARGYRGRLVADGAISRTH